MQPELVGEVTLPDDLEPPRGELRNGPPGCVLLTGATGFLGAFVLAELLARTRAEVVCLVRAPDPAEAHRRLRDNLAFYHLEVPWERLRAVPGNIEDPRLGLGAGHDALAEEVDAIYHVGANVSLLPDYAKLKAVNVGGLLSMLRLAATGRNKPIHHVSSYSVLNASDYTGCRTALEEPLQGRGQGFRRGYPATKWVAERVGDLARERGWSVASYRAGLLTGDTRLGLAKDDVLSLNVDACRLLGLAQDLDFLMHLTPVDYAAAALVQISLGETSGHYHLVTSKPISWPRLVDWLNAEGDNLQRVPARAWFEQLRARVREHPHLQPVYFLLSLDPQRSFWSDANIFSMHFDDARARAALAGSGLSCPEPDSRLLRLYVEGLAARRT